MSALKEIQSYVSENAEKTIDIARAIWEYAELAFEEKKSARKLIEALEEEGFAIETGLADIPTAFQAVWSNGSGKPVMGLLAEYDALDGLSQRAGSCVPDPIVPGGAGHGCGHNLLGAGVYAAASALKKYMEKQNKSGTVILYGCPAEEGAGSKQFLARAGCFDGCDFVYTWHPSTRNSVPSSGNVAIMGANFVFEGVASHAGGAPHLGRSALDAVELMSVGVNYLREHMIDSARIHYAYSDAGGTAPNVVQHHAVVKYEVRSPKVSQVKELFERVVDVARGAALMTGTKMNYEITMAFSDYVPNRALSKILDECMREAGAPEWTDEDQKLAAEFINSYPKSTQDAIYARLEEEFGEEEAKRLLLSPMDTGYTPYDPADRTYVSGSTDVGDVGYAAPTSQIGVATACMGNVGHSWQNTAFSGCDIGMKGMLKAAEVMAYACVKTMDDPAAIEAAKKELLKKNGGKYECPLPDEVDPPIGRY